MRAYLTPLTTVLVFAAGCGGDERGIRFAMDTTYIRETARYEELLRQQLTAADIRSIDQYINCELMRIRWKLGAEKGYQALSAALGRYYRDNDATAIERVDRAMARSVTSFDEGACERLAKTGILGDTVWPTLREE